MPQSSRLFMILFFIFPLKLFAQNGPGAVQIQSMDISGPGCPQGSVHATLAPNGGAISVLFDQFQGQIEAGTRIIRVICDVRIQLKKPADMTFAFASADFRGFVNLEAGVRAVQRVRLVGGFDENGRREVNMSQQVWQGPASQDFVISVVQPDEGVQPVGCLKKRDSTMIRLRTVLAIHNKKSTGSGTIMVDSFDGGLLQNYRLQWSACPK